jgi:hypothetical protein
MKKILSILLLIQAMLFTSDIYSQDNYPLLRRDSLGREIVLLSIQQAQELDNKADLLLMLEKVSFQMNLVDSFLVRVIDDKNNVIAQQEMTVNELKYLILTKDRQIQNLQNTVADFKLKELKYSKEIDNKDHEIKLHKDEINKIKRNMLFGGIGSGTALVAVVTLLLLR